MHQPLYLGNTNSVGIDRLRLEGDDITAGPFITNASITLIVKDSAGVALTGALALAYVAGSKGQYKVVVPVIAALVEGAEYFLFLDGTPGGATYHVESPCRGTIRRD